MSNFGVWMVIVLFGSSVDLGERGALQGLVQGVNVYIRMNRFHSSNVTNFEPSTAMDMVRRLQTNAARGS
jgi:hypothetical protein